MTLWLCVRDGNFYKGETPPTSRDPIRRHDLDRAPCPTVGGQTIAGGFAHQHWIEDDGMSVWLNIRSGTFTNSRQRINLDSAPCLTVLAGGIGPAGHQQYYLEDDGMNADQQTIAKPPYRVPLMAEVAAVPWNGLTVVSTFAGAGGSSLGYRMAGYRVLWANEFVPAAQDSYRANMAPGTVLDGRDIKHVRPEEILAATGLAVGELDVLDGSPPCQAFSQAGTRARGWGKDKTYEHGAKQQNENLFAEYIRLLRGLMPRTFVAENVSGLIKGVAKGFFLEILADFKASGYRVEARLLDAQWLGVPQQRQRIIFVGVREDLGLEPAFPKPLPYRYSVREAIPGLVKLVIGDPTIPQLPGNTFKRGENYPVDLPCRAINASSGAMGAVPTHEVFFEASGLVHQSRGNRSSSSYQIDDPAPTVVERRKFTIQELKAICAFPPDFDLTGSYAQQWARLGNSVPPVMMHAIAAALRDQVFRALEPALEPGSNQVPKKAARSNG